MNESRSLAYLETPPVQNNGPRQLLDGGVERLSISPLESEVFKIMTRQGDTGRVIIIGRASRKHTVGYLNIPIGSNVRQRLNRQIVGSLAMGISGLLEWALAELERKHISLEIQPKS